MTPREKWLRLFNIFGYCTAGYWLLVVCPYSLRSVVHEGGFDLTGGLAFTCYSLGIPAAMFMVSKSLAREGLGWRIGEALVLLALIALVVPMSLEFSRGPKENIDLLFSLVPLGLYLLALLGAVLVRGRSFSGISTTVRPRKN